MISKISLLRSSIKYNSFNGILKSKSYIYKSTIFGFSKKILKNSKSNTAIPKQLFKIINPHKFSKNKQSKVEKHDHQASTQQTIQRQLLNDCIQLPLKFVASYLSGWSGTFYAQFLKSIIDFCNHLFLYLTSLIKIKPSQIYPYGEFNRKYLVCYIPTFLFFFFGLHVTYEGFLHLFHQQQSHFNIYCVYIYIITMLVQLYVVARNVKVARSLSRVKENQKSTSFIQGLIKLKQGKDPLFRAVLYENLITVVSTSIPIICSFFKIILGIPYIQQIGTITIGLIQVYLAGHLFTTTSQSLQGQRSIESQQIKRIQQIILKNQFVEKIVDLKAVKLESQNFRISLQIRMDLQQLLKQSYHNYYQYSNRFLYQDNLEQRQKILDDFFGQATLSAYSEAQDQIQQIEADIKAQFPNCVQIDIDLANDEQSNLDNDPQQLVLHEILQQQTPERLKIDTQWLIQATDKIINKLPKKQNNNQQKVREMLLMDEPNITQYLFLNEDLRFQIYTQILNQQLKKQ